MRIITLITALCLLVPTGCGKGDKKKKAGDGKPTVNITEDGISVKTKDGSLNVSAGKGAKIPPSFPKDVLVYEDATVLMAMEVPNGHQAHLKTEDEPDQVAETYLQALLAEGWTKDRSFGTSQSKGFGFSKEGRTLTLSVATNEGATHIAIAIMKLSE